MVTFRINLIREQAVSPETRQRLFRGITIYLVVCAVLLVLTANRAASRYVTTANLRQEIDELEQEFRLRRAGESSVVAYGQKIKRDKQGWLSVART